MRETTIYWRIRVSVLQFLWVLCVGTASKVYKEPRLDLEFIKWRREHWITYSVSRLSCVIASESYIEEALWKDVSLDTCITKIFFYIGILNSGRISVNLENKLNISILSNCLYWSYCIRNPSIWYWLPQRSMEEHNVFFPEERKAKAQENTLYCYKDTGYTGYCQKWKTLWDSSLLGCL